MRKYRTIPQTLLVTAAALFCAAFAATCFTAHRGWQKSSAELNAARPPASLPSPNAFPIHVAAANAITDTSFNKLLPGASPPRPNDPAPKRYATLAAKDSLLRRNAPALEKLRAGFAFTYREPPAAPTFKPQFPYYARYREMARLLAFESELKAAHGDAAGAVQSALDAVRLGLDVQRGSTLIGRLSGIACERVGRSRLWAFKDRLNAPQARSAARRLEALESGRPPLWETMEEEKQWTLACFREWYRDPDSFSSDEDEAGGEEDSRNPFMLALVTRATIRGGIRGYTDYMDRNIADLHLPYPRQRFRSPPPKDSFLGIFDPDYSAASALDSDDHAQNLLLATAFGLRAYRLEHNGYPERLEELVPAYLSAVPEDPFADNRPLAYRRGGARYLLYSIGPDAADDSGAPIDDPREATARNPRARYRVNKDSKGDIVAGVNP